MGAGDHHLSGGRPQQRQAKHRIYIVQGERFLPDP
jgi:hypothetical protein